MIPFVKDPSVINIIPDATVTNVTTHKMQTKINDAIFNQLNSDSAIIVKF